MKSLLITAVFVLAGFSLIYGSNYYWVGNSGNWSDVSHWATTSGGTTKYTVVPTSADNVFFDANSFTLASQTVTVNVAANCLNMDWTGALNTPTLAGGSAINIYGSLTLISGMNLNSSSGLLSFLSNNLGNTITTAGKSIPRSMVFNI